MSDYELLVAEEELIADAQMYLLNLMAQKRVSKAELARLLGVSNSAVSQMFSLEPKNLSLRKLARVAAILGERISVSQQRKVDRARRADRVTEKWVMPTIPASIREAANENSLPDDREFYAPVVKFDLSPVRKKYRTAA